MWKTFRIVAAALFVQFLFPTLVQMTNWDFLRAYQSWLWFVMFWYVTVEVLRIDAVHERLRKWASSRNKEMGYIIAAIVGVVVGLGYWHAAVVLGRGSPMPTPAIKQPVIEVSYGLGEFFVPIPVHAKTTIRMVLIDQNRTAMLYEVTNNGQDKIFWPTDFPRECSYPVGVLRISNRGDVDVYDAVVTLTLLIGGDNIPEGLARVPLNLPPVSLPATGEPAQFYVVDQSSFGGVIQFPPNAMMQVRGERERRQIKLTHRVLAPVDNYPALIPSTYDWSQKRCKESAEQKPKQQ